MEIIGCGFFLDFVLTLVLQAAIMYFLVATPLLILEKRGIWIHDTIYFVVGFVASLLSLPIFMVTRAAIFEWLGEQMWINEITNIIIGY